jgi:hypothetical protein
MVPSVYTLALQIPSCSRGCATIVSSFVISVAADSITVEDPVGAPEVVSVGRAGTRYSPAKGDTWVRLSSAWANAREWPEAIHGWATHRFPSRWEQLMVTCMQER